MKALKCGYYIYLGFVLVVCGHTIADWRYWVIMVPSIVVINVVQYWGIK